MVQDQLVDYISSQLKLGVASDAIKSALVSAGWVAGDVDDTLKKIQGSAGASAGTVGSGVGVGTGAGMGAGAASAKPAGGMASSPASTGSTVAGSPAVAGKIGPQMIRVSDLVSASPSMSGSSATASGGMNSAAHAGVGAASTTTAKSASAKIDPAALGGKISGNTFKATPTAGGAMAMGGGMKGGSSAIVAWIVAAVFLIGFGGLAWYFYSGNAALSAKVSSLTGQSATVNAQLATLQSQVAASSTGMMGQIVSLTSANQDLALDLSFYAPPTSGASSTAGAPQAQPITISTGWLSMVKSIYWITTPQGAKIAVANSSDAKIVAQLKPLVGDTVQAAGMYVPGSDQMTLATVTDLSPAAPVTATTTP